MIDANVYSYFRLIFEHGRVADIVRQNWQFCSLIRFECNKMIVEVRFLPVIVGLSMNFEKVSSHHGVRRLIVESIVHKVY